MKEALKSYQVGLKLKSKKRLFAKLQGEHSSIFSGSGKEFLELKEYDTTADAKHINWKRSALTQEPLVNIYGDERELNIVVVYLVSGSLLFDNKAILAKDVCSILSFSATASKERLNLLYFSNQELAFYQNIKSSGFDIAYESASKIEHLGQGIDYNSLSNFLLSVLTSKSIIFLVGDFLEPNIELSALSSQHELYVVAIRSKKEEQISAYGDVNLLDAIKQKSKSFFISKSVAKNYNSTFKEQDRAFFNSLAKNQVAFSKIYKSSDTFLELQRLFRVV